MCEWYSGLRIGTRTDGLANRLNDPDKKASPFPVEVFYPNEQVDFKIAREIVEVMATMKLHRKSIESKTNKLKCEDVEYLKWYKDILSASDDFLAVVSGGISRDILMQDYKHIHERLNRNVQNILREINHCQEFINKKINNYDDSFKNRYRRICDCIRFFSSPESKNNAEAQVFLSNAKKIIDNFSGVDHYEEARKDLKNLFDEFIRELENIRSLINSFLKILATPVIRTTAPADALVVSAASIAMQWKYQEVQKQKERLADVADVALLNEHSDVELLNQHSRARCKLYSQRSGMPWPDFQKTIILLDENMEQVSARLEMRRKQFKALL